MTDHEVRLTNEMNEFNKLVPTFLAPLWFPSRAKWFTTERLIGPPRENHYVGRKRVKLVKIILNII